MGEKAEFRTYAAFQMMLWICVAVLVIAGVGFASRYFEAPATKQPAAAVKMDADNQTIHVASKKVSSSAAEAAHSSAGHSEIVPAPAKKNPEAHAAAASTQHAETKEALPQSHAVDTAVAPADAHKASRSSQETHAPVSRAPAAAPHTAEASRTAHTPAAHGEAAGVREKFPVVGMAFVNAVIQPLDHELNHRFYGWRPNDIADVTDNVNNYQLGVLEVTRRSAVILAERLSRTGSTAAFDANLENAMNWLMIKADRYLLPSAESKYNDSLKEMRTYFNKLRDGEAAFYTRTDNLIPLLAAYEDLLGSCDENLVKVKEKDGKPVSTFKADDYFFYAQGVASAMMTILEAVQEDFDVLVSREGSVEVLHHAIESCHHAAEIHPWIILNSSPDSLFANHRFNIAAPISHARFYLGVLIKTLST